MIGEEPRQEAGGEFTRIIKNTRQKNLNSFLNRTVTCNFYQIEFLKIIDLVVYIEKRKGRYFIIETLIIGIFYSLSVL